MTPDDLSPPSETQRLNALRRTQLLDTAAEERFDRIVRMAATALEAEASVISLVDASRQWFKARENVDLEETPRDISFCDHAIRQSDVLVVLDARTDPRFANNPLVTGPPHIRFYAGAQLVTKDGFKLGTICVFDQRPRTNVDDEDLQMLRDLAATVMEEIEKVELEQVVDDLSVANAELQHRMGNMYAHVSSLISLVGRSEDDKTQLVQRLREKISVLGEAQGVLASHDFEQAPLSQIVRATLNGFEDAQDASLFELDFDADPDLSSRGVFLFTLVLHELATNAAKHGALAAADTASIHISWALDDMLTLEWEEMTGQEVALPDAVDRKGFGTQILTRIAPLGLNGEGAYQMGARGLKYRLTASLDRL